MKILVVGEFISEIYENAFFESFQELGHDVYKFSTSDYFYFPSSFAFNWRNFREYPAKFCEAIKRAQNKYHAGPLVNKINRDFVACVKKIRPDFVFIDQGLFFTSKTIAAARAYGTKVFGYCQDNPFSKTAPKYLWGRYLESCPAYDYIFSFHVFNLDDYKKTFGIDSELLRGYYLKRRNFPIEIPDERYRCDVMFIAHYEDDGRDEVLIRLVRGGYSFKLYGTEWHSSKYYDEFKNLMGGDIKPIREDYNIALNSCKIAICFFSKKLNGNEYTTRTLEIPATKTFMLSEYTDDAASLFEPDKEAVYFRDADEFIEKIDYYLVHDDERKKIAQNGYDRVLRDGHEAMDRAKQVIRAYERLKERY